MKDDAIWHAFASTGDPLYYLLYKTAEEQARQKQKRDRPEQAARPED